MTEIYFVRHGQASFGLDNYDKLSLLGLEQARLLGQYFRKLDLKFDAAYAGALRRHKETAGAVLEAMGKNSRNGLVIDPDFNELDSSDVTLSRLCHVINSDPEIKRELGKIHTDPSAIRRVFEIADETGMDPADEAIRLKRAEEFAERVKNGIRTIVKRHGPGEKVVVFSSGGPMAVTLRQVLKISRERTIRLGREIKNTAYTIFRHDQERLGLVMFNNIAHLEVYNDPDLLTYI